jgi:hypothetical protein
MGYNISNSKHNKQFPKGETVRRITINIIVLSLLTVLSIRPTQAENFEHLRIKCLATLTLSDEAQSEAKAELGSAKLRWKNLSERIESGEMDTPKLCPQLKEIQKTYIDLTDMFEDCRSLYLETTKVCLSNYFKEIGFRRAEACIASRDLSSRTFIKITRTYTNICATSGVKDH